MKNKTPKHHCGYELIKLQNINIAKVFTFQIGNRNLYQMNVLLLSIQNTNNKWKLFRHFKE